jgi:hypothetical protein
MIDLVSGGCMIAPIIRRRGVEKEKADPKVGLYVVQPMTRLRPS